MIFGTNLLTQSPVPVYVFSLFLSIAEKENQTESNWPEFTEIIFGPEEAHGVSEMDQKSPEAPTRVGGSRLSRGRLGDPPDLFPMPTPLIYTQTSRT